MQEHSASPCSIASPIHRPSPIDPDPHANLPDLIASRRTELGLSLRALQERSGVHYSHISKVESGDDMVGLAGLAGLSRGLELPLSELLRAAGISANLGLPSFAGYLDAVAPGLAPPQRRDVETAFQRATGLAAGDVPLHTAASS